MQTDQKSWLRRATAWALGALTLLPLAASVTPAQADPPSWARALRWRRHRDDDNWARDYNREARYQTRLDRAQRRAFRRARRHNRRVFRNGRVYVYPGSTYVTPYNRYWVR